MMRPTAILVAALVPALARAQEAALQHTLDSLRTALGAHGASAAVVFPDGRLWAGASGEAHAGAPVTDSTRFEIGSITKTFTAALVLRLAQEGRLRPDDTLARWVPDFPGAAGITLRQLLNHTSGLADVFQHPRYIPSVLRDPARRWRPADAFALLGEPHFAPGAGWRYSNTGYLLLGLVIERASGRSVSAALRGRLLEPLALRHTVFEAEEERGGPRAHAFVDFDRNGTADDLSVLMPPTALHTSAFTAGAMTSTGQDLARWLHALHTGGVVDSARYAEMTQLVERPDGHRYGLGVLVVGRGAEALYGHAGNSTGFSAAAFHSRADRVTVAILTNAHAQPMLAAARALLVMARAGPADTR
jgi:D-alanyl-D-alanine carboxypeptidase